MPIESLNPASGELIKRYAEMTPQQVNEAIEAAHAAFLNWRGTSFAERAERELHGSP